MTTSAGNRVVFIVITYTVDHVEYVVVEFYYLFIYVTQLQTTE